MSIERKKLHWNAYGWAAHIDEWASRDDVWDWLAEQMRMPALLATPARALDDIFLPPSKLNSRQLDELAQIVGIECIRVDPYERAFHACAKTYAGLLALRNGTISRAPDAILYPRSDDEVLRVLRFATDNGCAVVPWGGGTLGADCQSRCTIVVDMSGMDRVLEVNADSAEFEAGIVGAALEKSLRAQGRTLGNWSDDIEISTLGGWIATNSGGDRAFRYGLPRDWLISATIATPKGILSTQSEPALNGLLAGARGRLGIITRAKVRTRPAPVSQENLNFEFPDQTSAGKAMQQLLESDLPLSSINLADMEENRFWRILNEKYLLHPSPFREFAVETTTKNVDAVGLSVSLEGGTQKLLDSVAQAEKIASAANGRPVWRDAPGPALSFGYLRNALLEHGAAAEIFSFETSWDDLNALQDRLRQKIAIAFEAVAPCPGAIALPLIKVQAIAGRQLRLVLTLVFPRMLENEEVQWKSIVDGIEEAARPIGADLQLPQRIVGAIKHTLDPDAILPAYD